MHNYNLAYQLSTFFITLTACVSLAGCPCSEPPDEARTCGGYKFGTECNGCCGESNHIGVTVNDLCVCYEKPWEEYDYTPEGKTQALKPWKGKKPLVCKDREELTYKGVKAKFSGEIPIIAKDRCKLTLKDVDLDGKVAIRVEGRAKVNIINSKLRGSKIGLEVTDMTNVTLEKVELDGKVAIHADERAKAEVTNSKLRGSKIGIEATNRAAVTLHDSSVRAPVGLKVSVRGIVRGSDGSVKSKTLAIDVSDRGSVSLNGTDIKGEIKKTGEKVTLDL